MCFISFASDIEKLLNAIVADPNVHAKWLNTLSFLENCGARKIAACEHSSKVKQEVLKHAAEEFRHAYHLKRQIEKLACGLLEDYRNAFLLGGFVSRHYLAALDLYTSRYLSSQLQFDKRSVREGAYLLVTYAIELRAAELYLLYDAVLKQEKVKVSVKSILLEEKGHLAEMEAELKGWSAGLACAGDILRYEAQLCQRWLNAVSQEVIPIWTSSHESFFHKGSNSGAECPQA